MTPESRSRLLDELKPGRTVFVQGAIGESPSLIRALQAEPERARGVHFTACLIPGINRFDYGSMHPEARLTTFMASDAWRSSIADGRTRIVPYCYSQTAAAISNSVFDLAVFQVTPPDAQGLCSFGISGDFPPLAWRNAKRRIGIVNSAMPRPHRGETIPFERLDLAIEDDTALTEASSAPPSAALETISAKIAALVPDGAAIQTGIGAAPAAILSALKNHKNLRIRSGMVTEGYLMLAEAGALAANDAHHAGFAYGSAAFYTWLGENDLCAFASVTRTHGAVPLAETPGFVAINSALEIDLFGQANLEWRGTRQISGVGGAPDFARGAMAAKDGMSIIALPSTAADKSRIVPRLNGPTVSLARNETDVIVTEHGVARLRDKTMDERADALIAIAAPQHRGALHEAWRGFRRSAG
jgi:acyl-CoA hydrolase